MEEDCDCNVGNHHISYEAKPRWSVWVCDFCGKWRRKASEALEQELDLQRASALLELYQGFQKITGKHPRVSMTRNKVRVGPDLRPKWESDTHAIHDHM